METYAEMYAKAKKSKALKQLTPAYHKWEKENETIVGAFVSSASVSSKEEGSSYKQYIVESDNGLVKFAMGKAADNDFGETLVPGVIYAFTFLGQERISGNRMVNKFDVFELGDPDPVAKTINEQSDNGAAVDKK